MASALASTRVHVGPGDKRQTARGGAALVHYELERAKRAGRVKRDHPMSRELPAHPGAAGG
jgi:hypothetical protein